MLKLTTVERIIFFSNVETSSSSSGSGSSLLHIFWQKKADRPRIQKTTKYTHLNKSKNKNKPKKLLNSTTASQRTKPFRTFTWHRATPEGLQEYVIKYLTAGDNFLRQGPSGFEQAAQCYFKVLAVYPDKMNLLMNLEQNLPPPVMEIIVKLMAAEASKVDIE